MSQRSYTKNLYYKLFQARVVDRSCVFGRSNCMCYSSLNKGRTVAFSKHLPSLEVKSQDTECKSWK